LSEGRPNISDRIMNRDVKLVINTPNGKGPALDEAKIRSLAVLHGISCITTVNGARSALQAIRAFKKQGYSVKSLQEYHKMEKNGSRKSKSV